MKENGRVSRTDLSQYFALNQIKAKYKLKQSSRPCWFIKQKSKRYTFINLEFDSLFCWHEDLSCRCSKITTTCTYQETDPVTYILSMMTS